MLIPPRFCLVVIIVTVYDVTGNTVLEDLVEADSLILDLEDRNYAISANAYEKLKRKCSQDWETFTYVQVRVHDVRISERARSKMHEIISFIRMHVYVKQVLHMW